MNFDARMAAVLTKEGVVAPAVMDATMARNSADGTPVSTLLLQDRLLDETSLAPFLGTVSRMSLLTLPELKSASPDAIRTLPRRLATRHRMVPVRLSGRRLAVAVSSPPDLSHVDEIEFMLSVYVTPYIINDVRLSEALYRLYGVPLSAPAAAVLQSWSVDVDLPWKDTEKPREVPPPTGPPSIAASPQAGAAQATGEAWAERPAAKVVTDLQGVDTETSGGVMAAPNPVMATAETTLLTTTEAVRDEAAGMPPVSDARPRVRWTVDDAIAELALADGRDGMIDVMLRFAHRRLAAVSMFVVDHRSGDEPVFMGWQRIDEDLVSRDIGHVTLATQGDTVMAKLFAMRSPFLGPIAETDPLSVQLGRTARAALLVPVFVGDKLAAALYGDNGDKSIAPLNLAELHMVVPRFGKALRNLILRHKGLVEGDWVAPAAPAADPPPKIDLKLDEGVEEDAPDDDDDFVSQQRTRTEGIYIRSSHRGPVRPTSTQPLSSGTAHERTRTAPYPVVPDERDVPPPLPPKKTPRAAPRALETVETGRGAPRVEATSSPQPRLKPIDTPVADAEAARTPSASPAVDENLYQPPDDEFSLDVEVDVTGVVASTAPMRPLPQAEVDESTVSREGDAAAATSGATDGATDGDDTGERGEPSAPVSERDEATEVDAETYASLPPESPGASARESLLMATHRAWLHHDDADVDARLVELMQPGEDGRRAAAALARLGLKAMPSIARYFPGAVARDPFGHVAARLPVEEFSDALSVLARCGADLAAPILLAGCRHDERRHRYAAVWGLSTMLVPGALRRIVERVFDPELRISLLALDVLQHYRDAPGFDRALLELRTLCKAGQSELHRRRAITAVAELRDAGAMEILTDLLGTRPKELSDKAHDALVEISAQDFGTSSRRWRAWIADHQGTPRTAWLIDGLAHKDERIRENSQIELSRATGNYFGYRFDAPRADRDDAVIRWRSWWATTMKDEPTP